MHCCWAREGICAAQRVTLDYSSVAPLSCVHKKTFLKGLCAMVSFLRPFNISTALLKGSKANFYNRAAVPPPPQSPPLLIRLKGPIPLPVLPSTLLNRSPKLLSRDPPHMLLATAIDTTKPLLPNTSINPSDPMYGQAHLVSGPVKNSIVSAQNSSTPE